MTYNTDTPELYAIQILADLLAACGEWHEWLGLSGTELERRAKAADRIIWFGSRRSVPSAVDDDPIQLPYAIIDLGDTSTHELPSRMARTPYNDTISLRLTFECEKRTGDTHAEQRLEFVRRYNLVTTALRRENGKCCSTGWSMASFNREDLTSPFERDDEPVFRVEYAIAVAGNFR